MGQMNENYYDLQNQLMEEERQMEWDKMEEYYSYIAALKVCRTCYVPESIIETMRVGLGVDRKDLEA